MCLILFAWQAHPDFRLVVAANRDEYFRRPTSAARFWDDQPQLLAGRDLEQGGTWMGITSGGRFAALTNYRNPFERRDDAPSRGQLVRDFLAGNETPATYMQRLAAENIGYNGYTLLAGDGDGDGDGDRMWHYSNRGGPPQAVAPGVHGLSNHLLDTPWLKVTVGAARLQETLARPFSAHDLLQSLADTTLTPDAALPDTGVGLEWERQLSATRIVMPGYGTRCSTVLLVKHSGAAEFVERTYREDGGTADTVEYRFSVIPANAGIQ